jgi:hypothetical protein
MTTTRCDCEQVAPDHAPRTPAGSPSDRLLNATSDGRPIPRYRLRYTGSTAVSAAFHSSRALQRRVLRLGTVWLGCVCLLAGTRQQGHDSTLGGVRLAAATRGEDVQQLFERGRTWNKFFDATRAQRAAWVKTTAGATLPPDLVARFRRVSAGLRLLIVAEDWCPDSVNVVPYIAGLASAVAVPLRIIGRQIGEPLMDRHRTSDGRIATPTIVLLRGSDEVAAWVERPAIVQQWFRSMARDPESARRFGERQAWYDNDHGRTVLTEVIALAEQTLAGR